jgi:hypothetical protein
MEDENTQMPAVGTRIYPYRNSGKLFDCWDRHRNGLDDHRQYLADPAC